MARFFRYVLSLCQRKGCYFFLAFFYLSGLLLGITIAFTAGDVNLNLMRGIPHASVSIVGSLCITILPFLLSAIAVSISKPWLLLVISFAKGFLFSFIAFTAMQSFGNAGWLIRCLLCFSDGLFLPVLYFYWLRRISGRSTASCCETMLFLPLAVLIGSIDFRIISPFLARLIN